MLRWKLVVVTLLVGAMLTFGASMNTGSVLAVPPSNSSTDAWDQSQNLFVGGGTNPAVTPGPSNGDLRDAFGGTFGGGAEGAGRVLLRDGFNAGTVHYLTWQLTTPRTIRSFVTHLQHDANGRDRTYRGVTEFALEYWDGSAWVQIYSLAPAVRYSDTIAPDANTIIQYFPAYPAVGYNNLRFCAEVGPITADLFRARFKQAGGFPTGPSNASGPRIIELDGFEQPNCADQDSDADSVSDSIDNCVDVANPAQADADADSVGDACDTEGPDPNENGNAGVNDCADGLDNDGDGAVDQVDPDCVPAAEPCSPGSFSDDGKEPCTLAPLGTYVSGSGAQEATPCEPGSFSNTVGAIACTLAPLGTYVSGSGAQEATPCEPGSFSNTVGAIACSLAPLGTYVSGPGAQEATPCEPGSFSNTVGAIACTLAPLGTYVSGSGAQSPDACPVGTTTIEAGSTSFADCVPTDADGDGLNDNDDQCPMSDHSPTVVVGGLATSVPNALLPDGCTIADLIARAAAESSSHGEFVSAIASLTNTLKKAGYLSGAQKGSIQSAAAKSGLP